MCCANYAAMMQNLNETVAACSRCFDVSAAGNFSVDLGVCAAAC